jgi:hypothetical protein
MSTITPADRRARVASWTCDLWKVHLPRETDAAWIARWLARETRRSVRRCMRERLAQLGVAP